MRDVERIERIIKKVEALWKVFPDMRLGQLIENFAIQTRGDIWFQEDDYTEKVLDAFIKKYKVKL